MREKQTEVTSNKSNMQGPKDLSLRSSSMPKKDLKPKGKIREWHHKISVAYTVGKERIATK
jgi:hypothetical protein